MELPNKTVFSKIRTCFGIICLGKRLKIFFDIPQLQKTLSDFLNEGKEEDRKIDQRTAEKERQDKRTGKKQHDGESEDSPRKKVRFK